MLRTVTLGITAGLGLTLLQACEDSTAASPELSFRFPAPQTSSDKKLDVGVCAPGQGEFSLVSTNPYFPIDVGRQWYLEGEEDDEAIELLITVLDETELVAGVTTRVVEEREWVDGELIEVSRNYFAEASDGTVCYFGEEVDPPAGSWRADEPGNAPGIIMPADPRPGVRYQNEVAPGIAEDEARIVGIGQTVEVPAGTFSEAIRVREFNPLDAEKDYKVFAAYVGIIIDGPVELVGCTGC